jgi:Suppressor of fused protein (SUFU)
MSEKDIESVPGSKIFTYTDGEKEWQAPYGEQCIQEISDHIERYIGKIYKVFHESISDTVHIDVHWVKPTKKRPYHTLVTSGMSDLPMSVPDDDDDDNLSRYMELMMTLPEFWELGGESIYDEKWYWPIREIKFLARFPHKCDTWLGWGHTMPNGNPVEPFADNTALNGVILLPPLNAPEEFFNLAISEDKVIEFYSVVPLYEEEMDLKLRKGSDELLDRFDKYGINDIISIDRRNVAKPESQIGYAPRTIFKPFGVD